MARALGAGGCHRPRRGSATRWHVAFSAPGRAGIVLAHPSPEAEARHRPRASFGCWAPQIVPVASLDWSFTTIISRISGLLRE